METKTIARIGAAAFVGVVITMTALQMRDAPAGPIETEIITLDEEGVDPLPAELRRCQALGAEGANDAMCLRAWAENRSRFFMSSERDDPQPANGAKAVPPGNDSAVSTGNTDAATASPIAPTPDGNR
jgi:conjugative transfer region protein TrbK